MWMKNQQMGNLEFRGHMPFHSTFYSSEEDTLLHIDTVSGDAEPSRKASDFAV